MVEEQPLARATGEGGAPQGIDARHRTEAQAALGRIEQLVRSSRRLDPERREALLEAARELERALEPAVAHAPARVRSVASAAELAVHEAAHDESHHPLVERALAALDEAARPLEERAPRVVEAVGRIVELLASLGI